MVSLTAKKGIAWTADRDHREGKSCELQKDGVARRDGAEGSFSDLQCIFFFAMGQASRSGRCCVCWW
jgi:hypothetical protein